MDLLPVFLSLTGRDVLLVGAGRVAEGKLEQLVAAGAQVHVVAPEVSPRIRAAGVDVRERRFVASDLDGMWLVVAAANPEVNRVVADAAATRHIFVNAVDDPANATAFMSGVVRRGGVTIAISTGGDAPALAALLREALNAVLPENLEAWLGAAREERAVWRRTQVPFEQRKPLLLRALNRLHPSSADDADSDRGVLADPERPGEPRVPWLNAPEDSWL